VLNVVVIDCCLTLLYCAFQPVVALINHLLTYLLTYTIILRKVQLLFSQTVAGFIPPSCAVQLQMQQ